MANMSSVPEPSRSTEVARLELSRLPSEAPLERVFRRACELSAEALGVERVGVWLFIDDRSALRCVNLFERSKAEHSTGSVLRVADFPTYFASLKIRKAVPAEIAASEPWTAELAASYLEPLGISSMLDAGIFVDSDMVGVVCHEHVGAPREWTTEARDFAGSIADLLALRVQAAEAREQRAAFQTHRQRLADQAKSEALAKLAAGVAHDFKNLLAVFLGQGEMLSRRTDLPPEAQQQARTIVDAAERGVALAAELLEFARPLERPPAVVDLAELTADCLPMLQAAVGPAHELRYSRPAALGQVLIDKTQYTRLLLNLVVNAREAMPGGGPIDICLIPVKLTHPNHAGRFVLLEVTDRGAGMDEATQRRIFEPFFTSKRKGTGLGLAIVHHIVDRAGGLIRVESAPGRGTTFRLFFPRIGAGSGATAVFPLPPELKPENGS
jgi:signal transduction histidine kinase